MTVKKYFQYLLVAIVMLIDSIFNLLIALLGLTEWFKVMWIKMFKRNIPEWKINFDGRF